MMEMVTLYEALPGWVLGKSVSGYNFQTIRKLANNDFKYHREIIYSIEQYILTQKMCFSSCK